MSISCSVCIEDINLYNQTVSVLKCGHVFHLDCLQQWFRTSKTCPECRDRVYRNRYVRKIFPKLNQDELFDYNCASDETKELIGVYDEQTKMLKNKLLSRMVSVEKESSQVRELFSVAKNDLRVALKDKEKAQNKVIELEFNLNRAMLKIQQMVKTNFKMSTDLEKVRNKEQSLVSQNKYLKNDIETANNDFRLLVSEAIDLQESLESSQINKQWLKNKNKVLQQQLITTTENNKKLLNTTSILKQKMAYTTSYNKFLVKKNQQLIEVFKTTENKEQEKTKSSQYSLYEALEENQNGKVKPEKLLQNFRLPEEHNLKTEQESLNEELKNVLIYDEMLLESIEKSKRSKESLEKAANIIKKFLEEKSFIFKKLSSSKIFRKDNPNMKEKLFSVLNKFRKVQNILRFIAQVRFDCCFYLN